MPDRPIRVLLFDDHALVRDTLCAWLAAQPDIEVAGVGGSGDEVVALAQSLTPDVVVLDIDMPGETAFAAAQRLRELMPRTRIIFLSAYFHDRYIESALRAGAVSYVTKDEPPPTIAQAIRRAMRDEPYFSPKVLSRLVADEHGRFRLTGDATRFSALTDRELEVLRMIAKGHSKKAIAATLHRSYSTIDKHVENVMNKLDIHDRVELARFAIREGLVEP
jgi:DNA-binding NarL/FixJ family response regulator